MLYRIYWKYLSWAFAFLKEKEFVTEENDINLYYRASFFGAGLKELCRIWLDRDCKESPKEMAQLIYREYTNRDENN